MTASSAGTAMSSDLTGRVALVTGGARGIGLEIVRQLSAAGAKVAVCDLPSAEEVAREQALPAGAKYVSCDVTNEASVQSAITEVVRDCDGLHILVNNAGIAIDGLLLRTKSAQWHKVVDVNLNGAFNCCKAAAKYLLRAKAHGRIVSISSVVGERGNVGQAAYAASKAGLLGLTRTLALEFAARGVTVNAVAPGFIQTKMTDEHLDDAARRQLLAQIPLGSIGEAADVASAVCFLCSDGARYITGQVLRVNGGLHI